MTKLYKPQLHALSLDDIAIICDALALMNTQRAEQLRHLLNIGNGLLMIEHAGECDCEEFLGPDRAAQQHAAAIAALDRVKR